MHSAALAVEVAAAASVAAVAVVTTRVGDVREMHVVCEAHSELGLIVRRTTRGCAQTMMRISRL